MPCQEFDYYEEHEAQKRADWENLRDLISECGGGWIYSSEYGRISFQDMTAKLCSLCKGIPDMSKMSHSMQHWWLRHREFDELREVRNKQQNLEVGKRMRENRIVMASLGDTKSFTRLMKYQENPTKPVFTTRRIEFDEKDILDLIKDHMVSDCGVSPEEIKAVDIELGSDGVRCAVTLVKQEV